MVRCASCRTGFFASLADDQGNAAAPAPTATDSPASSDLQSRQQTSRPDERVSAFQPSAADGPEGQRLGGLETDPAPASAAETSSADMAPPDQGPDALDPLFEAELEAARQEAEEAARIIQEQEAAEADETVPVTGWRKFMPKRSAKAEPYSALEAKPDARKPKAAARSPARSGTRRASAKQPWLAHLKSPLGLGLAGLLLIAAAVMQRQTVVRILPGSAATFSLIGLPVNLKGLEFAEIRSTSLSEGEARFLVVEGGVRSVHPEQVQVPLIEVRLRGEDGRTLYTWTAEPPRKSLNPGEALHFRTRLATPPEAGRSVEVRFTDKLQGAPAGS